MFKGYYNMTVKYFIFQIRKQKFKSFCKKKKIKIALCMSVPENLVYFM